MDEKTYLELLDKAYEELPQVSYKKERFEVPEVKGRLVKTRTIVSNFREIAKHLSRDENHLTRYMLKEVGVRGEMDQRGELILHSRFQPGFLNKTIKKYFIEYVTCPHCNSPDTVLVEEFTNKKCNACGHVEKVAKI